jgi:hypothetical protein
MYRVDARARAVLAPVRLRHGARRWLGVGAAHWDEARVG